MVVSVCYPDDVAPKHLLVVTDDALVESTTAGLPTGAIRVHIFYVLYYYGFWIFNQRNCVCYKLESHNINTVIELGVHIEYLSTSCCNKRRHFWSLVHV